MTLDQAYRYLVAKGYSEAGDFPASKIYRLVEFERKKEAAQQTLFATSEVETYSEPAQKKGQASLF